jgi:hypothetical protein
MTVELRVRFEKWYERSHTSANLVRTGKGYIDSTTRVAWRAFQEGAISQGRAPVHTPDWFDNSFVDYNSLTPEIRAFSERVCREFNIIGVSDPAYIANLVATVFGVGDGRGNFTGELVSPTALTFEKMLGRLTFAYSSSIPDNSSALRTILSESFASTRATKLAAIRRLKYEVHDHREDYLQNRPSLDHTVQWLLRRG